MKIAIVGAGFTGLTAALRLAQKGDNVKLFEEASEVGGLASGFKLPGWQWPAERFYHHIFTNDRAIRKLAEQTGYQYSVTRPTTAIYSKGQIFPFDSPLSLFKFPYLGGVDKVRMGLGLGLMKMWPEWKNLERYEADKFLGRWLGKSGYETIWQPLLKAKFGKWYKQVNAAWFWARIKKRTPSLGYFYEGFQGFANHLQKQITAAGGSVFLNTPVKKVGKIGTNLQLVSPGKKETFDKVLVTTNNSIFLKLAAGLPDQEREKLAGLQSLNALVTVLVAKKPLMDTVYWLNVLDNGLPFVVVAEQTKLVEPARYNGSRLIYFGTYLTPGQKLFSLADEEIFQMAIRQANKINPAFTETDVEKYFIFRAKETQPLVKTKHSKSVPNLRTGINNLYLANMNSIYPWDRGTNYAVELGERAVKMIEGE